LQTIGLRGEELYIQRQNNMRKAASKSNGKFRERGLRREEPYIPTHNNKQKGASKNNGNMFRKTTVKERRVIHSDAE
jgi:hypothetical protein